MQGLTTENSLPGLFAALRLLTGLSNNFVSKFFIAILEPALEPFHSSGRGLQPDRSLLKISPLD